MTTPLKSSEIAHNAQHCFLLRTHNVRGADQLGGAAELGARSGRSDLRHRLTPPYQRSCIGLHPGAGFDGYGFAGEHGLVEQDFSPGEAHIRGDYSTVGKLHHVAWDKLGREYGLPRAVAPDRCIQREPRLERGKGRLGAAFLEQPECGVEHQETGDDRRLGIVPKRDLEHDRSLEHPRNGRP